MVLHNMLRNIQSSQPGCILFAHTGGELRKLSI